MRKDSRLGKCFSTKPYTGSAILINIGVVKVVSTETATTIG